MSSKKPQKPKAKGKIKIVQIDRRVYEPVDIPSDKVMELTRGDVLVSQGVEKTVLEVRACREVVTATRGVAKGPPYLVPAKYITKEEFVFTRGQSGGIRIMPSHYGPQINYEPHKPNKFNNNYKELDKQLRRLGR